MWRTSMSVNYQLAWGFWSLAQYAETLNHPILQGLHLETGNVVDFFFIDSLCSRNFIIFSYISVLQAQYSLPTDSRQLHVHRKKGLV